MTINALSIFFLAKLVEMPLDEVDGLSSGQRAVSSSASLYENIEVEDTMTTQTGQDTDHFTILHPQSRTSFPGDPVSLCPVQQIQVIDKIYENASTCICRGNQPFQAALTTMPTTDTECPSTDENYPQDNSAVEGVAYIKVVSQVRIPAPYETLQPFSESDPI